MEVRFQDGDFHLPSNLMATHVDRQFTPIKNLNLRSTGGILRFETPDTAWTTTSGHRVLYTNSSDELVWNNGSTTTVLGAAGAPSAVTPTLDAIYANDTNMNISGTTLTFDRSAGAGDVFTLKNTGAGAGHVLQITNVGTGKDVNGTSGSWSVSKTGVAILEELTIDGTEGSNIFTVTVGDTRFLDGAVAITDDDDAASFTVTNNTATTASVVVVAGSGAHTGSTTTSFMTITPSGLTTGTAVYLPVAALTTGKAIHVVANAVTDGLVVNITSSSTVHTATGRLLNIASTAATNTSAVLNEFATSANDETVLLRLTASDILAAGKVLHISASSMTTGTAIDMAALDALTTGIGISVASTSTGITTGSLARFSTGTTGLVATSGVVSIRGTGAHTSTSNVGLLDVQSSGMVGTLANSTLVNIKATGAAQVDTTLLNVEASGFTTGYTGSMVRIKSVTTTGACKVIDILADGITSGGTAVDLSVDALTTGIGLNIANSGGAMTSGSLMRVAAQGTGAIATNGIISFTHTGAFTSTSAVDGGFVEIKANDTTAGTVLNLVADALTTGIGVQLSNATSAMTSGSLLRVTTSGTGIIATNGIVSITHAGIFTSTSNAGVLDVQASALVGTGTLVNLKTTAAAQLTTTVLNVENSGFTIGYTGEMLRIKTPSTTGACKVVSVIADGMTAGTAINVSAAALSTGGIGVQVDLTAATAGNALKLITTGIYTGTGMGFIEAGAMTTGVLLQLTSTTGLTSGSLLRATSSTAGAIATNGAISLSATGAFTSTARAGFLNVAANTTTGGTIAHISGTAVTDGTILSLEAVEATLSTGLYIQCYDGAANDFSVGRYGATTIAGNASGTAALTITAGDFLMSSGILRQAVTATITADVGSIQGGSALTRGVNEISICATAGDAVTLPTAVAGQLVYIVNHGAQSADVFPASGDAINEAAVNTAKALAADAAMICHSYDGTNWECNTLAR